MKVLFVGGGTLGHIFPTFSIIDLIKENGGEVYFICGKRKEEIEILNNNKKIDSVFSLDMIGLKRKITINNIVAIKKYFKAKKESKRILKEIKPDIVIGMGGYVSSAVLSVAINMKIKTIIHEQNSVYGLVNKVFKNKVDKVLLSFEIENGKNIVLVGNPRVSEYYYKYCKNNDYKKQKNKILVLGGTLGSEKINDYFINNYEKFIKENIEVTLITGKKYYEKNEEKIKNIKYPFEVIPFSNHISDYMINSKIIISRSGATTISEIFGLKKMAILIPSPNVVSNHQYKNAKYFYDRKCIDLLEESDIDNLFSKIVYYINADEVRKNYIKNISEIINFDSNKLFYEEILKMVGEDNHARI